MGKGTPPPRVRGEGGGAARENKQEPLRLALGAREGVVAVE
jgi:hypothetical protein